MRFVKMSLFLVCSVGALRVAEAVDVTRVGTALTVDVNERKVSATLKDGYHFNLKAPNQVSGLPSGSVRPQVTSDKKLEITLPEGFAKASSVIAVLYVCDDANTFCDIERRPLFVASAIEKTPAENATSSQVADSQILPKINRHGFYEREFTKVQKYAEDKGKVLLIEFGARWCPGCQRLTSEVLHQKSFQSAASELVKFHADIDLFENFDLVHRYDVKGVPTLLFIDSMGAEIARLVDYRPVSEVVALVKEVKARPLSIEKLKASLASDAGKAKQSDLHLLGRRLLAAGRNEEALKILAKMSPPPREYFQAKVQQLAAIVKTEPSETKRLELRKALEEAVKSDKESYLAFTWRSQLALLLEKSSPERLALVAEQKAWLMQMLSDSGKRVKALTSEDKGEYAGLERFFLAVSWAEFLDELGEQPAELKEAWEKAAEIGQASGITEKQEGPALRYLIVLVAAERFADADQWVLRLIKRQPENKDLLRRRAKILNGQKRFAEAAKVGEESRKSSDGRVEFLVVEQLVKSYVGLDKSDQAKKLLDEVLTRPELQLEKMKAQKAKLVELRSALK